MQQEGCQMANSLDDLFEEAPDVQLYFCSLPPDMQDAISMRSEEIRSVNDLQQYVELLMN